MKNTHAIPVAHNLTLAVAFMALQLFQLFAIPLFLLPLSPAWGLLVVLFIPLSNSMWALMHEAVHRLLHPSAKINDYWGRALSVLFGVSLDIVKFGHLMHHRFNRDWESENYNPAKKPHWRAKLDYYSKMCGGLYVMEVAGSVLFLLPDAVIKKFFRHHAQTAMAHLDGIESITSNYFFLRGHIHEVRIDALAVLLVYGASLYAYGGYWPWFALMVAGRAFAISFMDNIYHYATPADNSIPAKEVAMPRWMTRMILHNNHHYSHHRQSDVPWNGLPELQKQSGVGFHQTIWQAARDQFEGPVAV